ncbi:tripartite motif-containing 13-like [Dendronephthya gigantea]|uniref:tripartite motif-containing 13-like n=1 Tax=Dendronephthya gigantea TaxID=151771 RepID=UPI00106ABD63|nr:tripartite motif-containing 13-like [Dendronephthya gigantea]
MMEEAITCKICAEKFCDKDGLIPRILTACGHSFCESCLNKLQKKAYITKDSYSKDSTSSITIRYKKTTQRCWQYEIKCPKCKTKTISDKPSSELPKNYAYLDLLDEVVTNGKCPVHPNYVLDMFCHEEEEAVCMYCTTYGQHKTHKVSKLSWFSDKQAESIQNKIDCIDNVINDYNDLSSSLDARKHNLRHKAKYVQNAITSRFLNMQSEINSILEAKQESVLSELNRFSTHQMSLLKMQKEAAMNFTHELSEKKSCADHFLATADKSSIAKERKLQDGLLKCLDDAQNHKMLTNNLFEVCMGNSEHIVKSVKEMVNDWVCSVEETKLEPLLKSVSTLSEQQAPCLGESMAVMCGEASEITVKNSFDEIDCHLWCDGEMQHWETDCDGKTDCDLETDEDSIISVTESNEQSQDVDLE